MEPLQRSTPDIERRGDKVYLKVRLQPSSSREEVCLLRDGALRIKVTVPPAEGRANEACCALLARTLGLAKSRLRVWRGLKSRQKIIEIDGIDEKELAEKLNLSASCGSER